MGAVELDFWDVYRIDVLDLFRGRLSPRRAVLLLSALPESSNTRKHFDAAVKEQQARVRIEKLKARRNRLRVVSPGG